MGRESWSHSSTRRGVTMAMASARHRGFWRLVCPRAAVVAARAVPVSVAAGVGTAPRGGGLVGGLYQIRISHNDMYDVPNRRLIEHRVDGRGYLKLGPLRAPLDPPYFFAQEGMIEELAYLAKLDPRECRRRNISERRWIGVLEAAAKAARWTPRVAAANVSSA